MTPPADRLQEPLEQIARAVERVSGLVFQLTGRRSFERAVAQRAVARSGGSLAGYAELLEADDGEEMQALLERLVVRETSFFRLPAQFEALRSVLLPAIDARLPPGQPVRIWSAGASTGEEAYSVAAVALAAVGGRRPVEVLGTDVSLEAVAAARRGRYPPGSASSIPDDLRGWAFVRDADGLAPAAEVRARVQFATHNLAAEPFSPPPGGADGSYHVVLCRNVLIYFAPSTAQRVLAGLHRLLASGGYLLVGHAEAMLAGTVPQPSSVPVAVPGGCVYQRVDSRGDPRRRPPEGARAAVRPARRPRAPGPGASRERERRRVLEEARRLADGGSIEAALALARAAARSAPHDAEAHSLVGVLAGRAGQLALARAALERAVAIDPAAPLAWVHLGALLRASGDEVGAVRAYQAAAVALDRLPPTRLVGEFAAGQLARLCRSLAKP